jgi:hypothetical protein
MTPDFAQGYRDGFNGVSPLGAHRSNDYLYGHAAGRQAKAAQHIDHTFPRIDSDEMLRSEDLRKGRGAGK